MSLHFRFAHIVFAISLGYAKPAYPSANPLSCESLLEPLVEKVSLVSGERANGGSRIGIKGNSGGAYRATVSVGGVERTAAETFVNDYYVDLGSFDITSRQAQALEAAKRASDLGLSPQFFGYIDVKLKHGELVRYLYFEEFGHGRLAVSDGVGELRGSWEIAPRIQSWLLEHKGQSEGQKIFDLVTERYRRLVRGHPDPHNDNILIGLFMAGNHSLSVRVEAIDWTHWMSYPVSNSLYELRKPSEKLMPIDVRP